MFSDQAFSLCMMRDPCDLADTSRSVRHFLVTIGLAAIHAQSPIYDPVGLTNLVCLPLLANRSEPAS